jgi:hypothetical protein
MVYIGDGGIYYYKGNILKIVVNTRKAATKEMIKRPPKCVLCKNQEIKINDYEWPGTVVVFIQSPAGNQNGIYYF